MKLYSNAKKENFREIDGLVEARWETWRRVTETVDEFLEVVADDDY